MNKTNWKKIDGMRKDMPGTPDAKHRRTALENKQLKTDLKKALDKQVFDQDYQKFVGRIESSRVRIPEWTLAARGEKHHQVLPVVNWSDFHLDEVVRPEEVQWKNAYNREIALMRLKRFTGATIKVALDYLKGFNHDGLVVNALGDNFSGSIHDELKRTNEDTMLGSMLYWAGPVCAMLKQFADAFGAVTVNGVVGNHGRLSIKPIFKGRVRDNYDWYFLHTVARELSGDKRITFNISESMKLEFALYGHKFIATHGDECRGGSGIAGMLSPQLIAFSRMQKTFGFRYWVLGHWHNLGAYRGIRVNGCGKGWDEYAMGSNFDFQEPQQDFFLVNRKHGVIGSLPIFCLDENEPWLKQAERKSA